MNSELFEKYVQIAISLDSNSNVYNLLEPTILKLWDTGVFSDEFRHWYRHKVYKE